MPGRGTHRHTVRIPDPLWKRAEEKAKRRGEYLSDVMRAALERYVEDDDEPRGG